MMLNVLEDFGGRLQEGVSASVDVLGLVEQGLTFFKEGRVSDFLLANLHLKVGDLGRAGLLLILSVVAGLPKLVGEGVQLGAQARKGLKVPLHGAGARRLWSIGSGCIAQHKEKSKEGR
jgi:hypothetical protein